MGTWHQVPVDTDRLRFCCHRVPQYSCRLPAPVSENLNFDVLAPELTGIAIIDAGLK